MFIDIYLQALSTDFRVFSLSMAVMLQQNRRKNTFFRNKLLYNQSIMAVNRKTQNTYMIIIQYDTDYYILNHSQRRENFFSLKRERMLIVITCS